jgi:hypothetical protein
MPFSQNPKAFTIMYTPISCCHSPNRLAFIYLFDYDSKKYWSIWTMIPSHIWSNLVKFRSMYISNFYNVDGMGLRWCITTFQDMLKLLSFEKRGIHQLQVNFIKKHSKLNKWGNQLWNPFTSKLHFFSLHFFSKYWIYIAHFNFSICRT